MLPAGPFAAWLRDHADFSDITAWAHGMGIDESQLRRFVRGERETVHIDVVDRVLLYTIYRLEDLYPELETDNELEAA